MTDMDVKKLVECVLDQFGIVAYVNEFGNYLYVNEKWSEETGIPKEKAVGSNVDEIIYGSAAMIALRSGRTITGEVFIQTLDGKETSGVMRYKPIFHNENIIGCLITSVFDNLDEAQNFSGKLEQILDEFEYLRSGERINSGAKYDINRLIGNSKAMEELKDQIYVAASSNASCLIEGETGTGKELVAHAIHNMSRRKIFPFVRVNCSAIPENLMESEFFGYEEGSFTGGVKGGKAGKFEKAHLGSMFLDEINAMSLQMQPKLLRALQEKEIERIGGVESIPVDVRVIAASNAPIIDLIEEDRFRRDLYYRLNIITIKIPPLRERKEDIYPLVQFFVEKYNAETLRNVQEISGDAIEYLMEYDWPGNVRELQNVVERTMASTWSERLTAAHFKKFSHIDMKSYTAFSESENTTEKYEYDKSEDKSEEAAEIIPLSEQKSNSEKLAIERALESCGYNKAKTARVLNISRTLLYKKLEKYNISC